MTSPHAGPRTNRLALLPAPSIPDATVGSVNPRHDVYWRFVPSPFLHASFWNETAAALGEIVPGSVSISSLDLEGIAAGNFYRTLAAQALEGVPSDAQVRLVVHSNAGLLVPGIATEHQGPTEAVFVDAALPAPGLSWLEAAPPPLVAGLRRTVREGRLAPWPQWFGGSRPRLIIDPTVEMRLYDACPWTPWEYLEEPSPLDRKWLAHPHAYLQLSEAYREEAAEAEMLGWRVSQLAIHHLAMVTEPKVVAEALVGLMGS